jgi:hypothetical protein
MLGTIVPYENDAQQIDFNELPVLTLIIATFVYLSSTYVPFKFTGFSTAARTDAVRVLATFLSDILYRRGTCYLLGHS